MKRVSESELKPRNGHTLKVGIGCRISGCANQKEQSLKDQEDHGKEVIAELYEGPVEYDVIASKGKGEALDRPELTEVEKILRRRELDIFVWEDLGRLVRGAEAVRLLGVGVDHGTRTIAPNDCIDTAEETWESDALNACAAHVGNNAHTSKRIKNKLMNRFVKNGGVLPCEVYGYLKPPGAKTYHDLQKIPEATPIYQEMFRRLRATGNQEKVADWLNEQKVPVGKYSRGRKKWYGKSVARARRNPLLKGMPGRGFRHTEKDFESGRRKSVHNPKGPTFSRHEFPHLVHVDPVEFDSVNALLDAKNKVHLPTPGNAWRILRKK
ncbi:recombinase family protein [Humisphaera borealis]|uniref:Recombinase family protein n=1 Tax=Humisphaera borealis TaxID=2807512 RepID=A0A7M2WZW4_9BACT|nr:recombinase family protein [Humisphaera borealis]QOV90943.1 recombinase family protein [Humisphaera borealis]